MPFRFFRKPPGQAEREQLREMVSHCWKRLRRDADLLPAEREKVFRQEIQRAQNVVTAEAPEPGAAIKRLLSAYERCFATEEGSDWVESIFVALVIAMAVRAFFLQPFKIPTGSMQPTLNGITVHAAQPDEKTWWHRLLALPVFGQNVIHITARSDGEFTEWRPFQKTGFFIAPRFSVIQVFKREWVELDVGLDRYEVPIEGSVFSNDVLGDRHGTPKLLKIGDKFRKGDVILDCVRQTGDYLFVDRFTYNFRKPKRGDVFVFDTSDIQGVSSPGEFYIKRIAGAPGDTLRIEDPNLYVNGEKAREAGLARVMSMEGRYRGYTTRLPWMKHLNHPEDVFTCRNGDYFALGDNSFFSQDSRFWGPVPYHDIVGRGFFVHWPFTRHFGRVE